MGCPNKCVFCDQHAISGVMSFSEENAVRTIEEHLASSDEEREHEIAFFGGSFTGIDRRLMIRLLDVAESYVQKGKAVGIRMSTRPDYIDEDVITVLRGYTVSAVELGVQSMNDRVLSASKRGHTSADSERAFYLLGSAGIASVGQMMIGLPSSTRNDEAECARRICECGASASRIYPTVVFENTELYGMMKRGEYTPLSVTEAVERSADALEVFSSHGVRCLRVGLYGGDAVSKGSAVAGPSHEAFGELVFSECYRRAIERELSRTGAIPENATVRVSVPRGAVSAAVGHRGSNRDYFSARFGLKKMEFLEKNELLEYNIKISIF